MAGKYNKVKEAVAPTAINEMGEKAYNLPAHEELVATCLTTFLQDSYYEKENVIVDRIKQAIRDINDPYFVAQLAVYLRHTANMRSISHLLAGELASAASGSNWLTSFYKKVYGRPDDMSEILSYLFHKRSDGGRLKAGNKRKVPNAIKRAFAQILAGLDPYTIDKYKMNNRTLKLVDLINLVHPKPIDKNKIAYERLMKGESLDDLYVNKTLEKTFSAAGQTAAVTGEDADDLKGDALRSMLSQPKGMPIMSLMRNLRNLLLYAPDMVDEAVKILTDPKRIENSKQLPFRFATAYNAVDEMSTTDKTLTVQFEKDAKAKFLPAKKQLMKALETALSYSVQNIPLLEGPTAILVDHSGSVRGDAGGSGKLSAFGVTTSAVVGNLFGSMIAFRQENVYIGLFGDRLIPVPVKRDMGLIEFNNHSFKLGADCGGSTENGLYVFLTACIKEKTRVDNLIIFSDMVIGDGGRGGWDGTSSISRSMGSFQTLFKQFKALNPQCRTICVDMRQTSGKSVFDRSLNVTNISGWSNSIFSTIGNASKGYDALINEIRKIDLTK